MSAKTDDNDEIEFSVFERQLKAPFSPHKIKWRVADFRGSSSEALYYIDARDVMDRLDEVFGIGRWTTEYTDMETRCVCKLSVSFHGGWGWVHKSDVGTPSTFESEKGMYSDALKRAAVQLGIGRYLYDDEIFERRRFPVENKRFTKEANEEIYQIVEKHYRLYTNPKASLLNALFQSATNLADLKAHYANNKALVEELKEQDAESAQYIAKLYKRRGSTLKRIEEQNNNG